jgi:cytoskeletal protein CcmA (bactofilin family)
MFFRKRSGNPQSGSPGLLFGSRVEAAPASIIGRNTRFRGEIRGGGSLAIRGHVEGSLRLQDRVIVDEGSFVHADILVTEMVLAGTAEGEIRVTEVLTVRSTGSVQGAVESGRILVEEGAILRGTLRRSMPASEMPPEQSTP